MCTAWESECKRLSESIDLVEKRETYNSTDESSDVNPSIGQTGAVNASKQSSVSLSRQKEY
jgi:hypothetical protein